MTPSLPYASQTLDEALLVFRRDHGLEAKYLDMSHEAQTLFERHDIIHVLFGLGTDLREEAQADGWTMLGSDISFGDVRKFAALPVEKELLKDLRWTALVKGLLRALPDYAGMAWHARKLTKRWRWAESAQYRAMPVADIRREFGIDAALS